MKAYLTIGIPGSGKTTWTQNYIKDNPNTVDINRDDIRREMFNFEYWDQYKFKKSNEERVSDAVLSLIKETASNGNDLILSNTNLNKKHRELYINILQDLGYEVECKVFDVDLEEAIKRDKRRKNSVTQGTIISFYQLYLQQYKPDEFYSYEKHLNLKKCIIVDIDGTVADHKTNNLRHSFDWNKVDTDIPITNNINMVKSLLNSDKDIELIFLSGRSSECNDLTSEWLKKHFGNYNFKLYMRNQYDYRKDTIVKSEIFNKHIMNNYNVVSVFDDRPCILRHWHSIGLKNIVAVGNPFSDF